MCLCVYIYIYIYEKTRVFFSSYFYESYQWLLSSLGLFGSSHTFEILISETDADSVYLSEDLQDMQWEVAQGWPSAGICYSAGRFMAWDINQGHCCWFERVRIRISTEFGSHSERDRRQYCSYKLTTPLLALEYIIITQLLTSLTALHLGVAERVLLRNIRYFLDNIYVKKEIEVKKLFYA